MKEIRITKGKVALIDDEMFDRVSRFAWYALAPCGIYYAATRIRDGEKQVHFTMHRLIMGFPDGFHIDHIDGNGLNNQKHNLRIATNAQNSMNRRKQLSESSSTFKGVSWDKNRNLWMAKICFNDETKNLGRYKNETAAALAYNNAACKYFGEFARLNQISVFDLRNAL